MDINSFVSHAQELAIGPVYWNHVLYSAAQTGDLFPKTNISHINGMIGLVGRSYSASPERRNYGSIDNLEGYFDLSGEKPAKRPIWPVRSAADGQGGFFDEVAKCLDLSWTKNLDGKQYKFDNFENDEGLLCTAIESVLRFNSELTSAIEKFDQVPPSKMCQGHPVKCSDHLSFSSKFLHFYFPATVFIIDSYSNIGGQKLFSNQRRTGCYFPGYDVVDNTVYAELKVKDVLDRYKEIAPNIQDRLKNNEKGIIETYAKHCLRSYSLACLLKKYKVTPALQREDDLNFRPMSRLTDSVLMAVRQEKNPSQKEIKHRQSMQGIYGLSNYADYDDMG